MNWDRTKSSITEFIVVPYSIGVPISLMGMVQASATDHSGYGANSYVNLDLNFLVLDSWDGNLFDGSEQQLSTFSFQTRSGASYGLAGTTVPEPGSIVLIGIGLAAIVSVSWKSPRRLDKGC
jgi:hypothetical protein